MPILIYTYSPPSEVDNGPNMIGVCAFGSREQFEVKAKALCVAYEWNWKFVKITHGYIGSVVDGAPRV